MKSVYIVKDKNARKPFIGVAKLESSAKAKVTTLQSKMKESDKVFVSYEAVPVSDFDMNKSSIYVVYDKTEVNNQKPFVEMFFDFKNAEAKVTALRKAIHTEAGKKLIFLRNEMFI